MSETPSVSPKVPSPEKIQELENQLIPYEASIQDWSNIESEYRASLRHFDLITPQMAFNLALITLKAEQARILNQPEISDQEIENAAYDLANVVPASSIMPQIIAMGIKWAVKRLLPVIVSLRKENTNKPNE